VDDGAVHATVDFADSEGPITLHGYAAQAPRIEATSGSVEVQEYQPETGAFSFRLAPSRGQRTVTIVLDLPRDYGDKSAQIGSA
jgi:hypothetical protein